MASRRCCVSRSKNQLCVKGEILFVQMIDICLLFLFKILLYYTRRVVICSRLNDDEIHLQKIRQKKTNSHNLSDFCFLFLLPNVVDWWWSSLDFNCRECPCKKKKRPGTHIRFSRPFGVCLRTCYSAVKRRRKRNSRSLSP